MTIIKIGSTLGKERSSIKADPMIQAMLTRSPAQGYQWVEDNVTDLASAKELLKRLTAVSMYLLKRQEQG